MTLLASIATLETFVLFSGGMFVHGTADSTTLLQRPDAHAIHIAKHGDGRMHQEVQEELLMTKENTSVAQQRAQLESQHQPPQQPATLSEQFAVAGERSAKKLRRFTSTCTTLFKVMPMFACINAALLLVMLILVWKLVSVSSDSVAESSEDKSIGTVLPSVLIWITIGITLICFNKYMYLDRNEGGFGLPCPMALTWWHMFTGMLATNIVYCIKPQLMPAVQEGRMDRHSYVTAVVPIGLVYAFYLAIGNMAYLYLSVSFIQMLKSAGPLCVYLISVSARLEPLTSSSVGTVAVVVMGVAGASVGEAHFTWIGFALQFVAFILDSLRLVMLKMLMSSQGSKLDPLSSLYYYSPICVISLLLPALYFEGSKLLAVYSTASTPLYGALVLNGAVAFALNISMLNLLTNASPTTVSVASVIRDVILTFGSAALFHTRITVVQVLGYFSACLGVKFWNEIKARPGAFYQAFGLKI